MDIEFDDAKRALTLQHRGLDFAEAIKVFEGVVLEQEDDRFDHGEVRLITVGMLYDRVVVLVSVDRGDIRRVIPMRLATKSEQDEYSNEWVDPNDAPPLTRDWFDKAELKAAGIVVNQNVPLLDNGGDQVDVRIDREVLHRFQADGPGWQGRINAALRHALGM